jgi:hypothetical protein
MGSVTLPTLFQDFRDVAMSLAEGFLLMTIKTSAYESQPSLAA